MYLREGYVLGVSFFVTSDDASGGRVRRRSVSWLSWCRSGFMDIGLQATIELR